MRDPVQETTQAGVKPPQPLDRGQQVYVAVYEVSGKRYLLDATRSMPDVLRLIRAYKANGYTAGEYSIQVKEVC